ncbi:TonB-dependent receptor [Pedobacter arcticus]|uniref:TonB-dependent receptor n=1 Tax=Pedobacter arcticus TaxID=752140 RepID=UPI0002E42C82|nr:TonB-dependent receptor [Pedobacter arcticus]
MQIKKILLTSICCLLFSVSFAQNKTSKITGKITDEDGLPIPGALIKIQNAATSTVSDVDGIFKLENLNAGNYTLLISSVGMSAQQKQVSLKEGASLLFNVSLASSVQTLESVNVMGKTKAQEIRESGFTVNSIETKKFANTSVDLNQILNRSTGIRVRESGGMGSEFKFSLNGFSGNQVKFFMDGIPIDNYGSSFTLNNIPSNVAERIDVYKGVVPIELGGDALGGAVNIVTNKSINRFIDASYSFGSFNTHKASINSRFTSKNGILTNFSAFTNYSDNSYKVDVSIADPVSGAFGPIQKYKHFHDGYRQATLMAEVGVKDKKFADYLLLGLAGSINHKETQQGATMLRVVGDAFTESKNLVPSLKYKKSGLFTKSLEASIAASYNIAEERKVDTSSRRYDWTGNSIVRNYETSGGEIRPTKTIMVFDVKSLQSNTNFKYNLNENHYLALNYTYLGYKRKENNEYSTTYKISNPYLNKNILGFSYNLSALDKNLTYTAFTKMFDLQGAVMAIDSSMIKSSFNKIGYGTAAAYFIIPNQLQIKASFEHAYRLQSPTELLGDGGFTTKPNPDLKPESSNNFNFGASYKKSYPNHHFGIQGNFLYRKASDFIQAGKPAIIIQYVNFKNVQISSYDATLLYGFKNWMTFELNGTYQKTLNMDKAGQVGTELNNYLYKKQIPNVPILYGNADLGFQFKKLRSAEDVFSINLVGSFADSYYLNPPSLGGQNKKEIPKQVFYSSYLAYSLKNGRYNIALECSNITNVQIYDYYNVQKPGRSFTLKLRYFIKN